LNIILKRIAIIVVLWTMLTGGAVFICSSGDGNLLLPGRNRPPVTEDSFLQTQVETSITSTMQASDPDGDDLTYRVTSGPDVGSLSNINADTGRFTYVPAALGTDSFTFKANDGRLDSDNGTVSILVTAQTTGTQVVGLESVLPDRSRVDGLTVLWGSPSGIIERLTGLGAGPAQSLLHGVEQMAADPWQSGQLLAYMNDGRLLTSTDGGSGWQLAGRLKEQAEVGALAYAGNRVLITIDDVDCVPEVAQGWFIPAAGGARQIDAELSCGHDPVLGSLDGSYFIRDGWLHLAGNDQKLFGPGVVAAATDPWRQKRVAVVVGDELGRSLLRISEDGGQTWGRTNRADLPKSAARGKIGQLVFDSEQDGVMFVSVWYGDGTTSVFRSRSENEAWEFIGSLSDGAAKLTRCAYDAVCLLSDDGTRMNRFPDTPDEG